MGARLGPWAGEMYTGMDGKGKAKGLLYIVSNIGTVWTGCFKARMAVGSEEITEGLRLGEGRFVG